MHAVRILTCLIVAALAAPARAAEAAKPAAAAPKPLYERLGGLKALSLVVDDFIDRLVANETLNANPAIDAGRKSSPAPYLKVQVAVLACQVTGGPCRYSGKGMKESHAHLNIGEKDWQAMLGDLNKSLDKFKVPETERREFLAIIESTKADIVVAAK